MNIIELNNDVPWITSDAITFGILMVILGLIFYSGGLKRFSGFYKVIPALVLCYFIPSIVSSLGIISAHWIDVSATVAHLTSLGYETDGIETFKQLKEFILSNGIEPKVYSSFVGSSKLYYVASKVLLPASLVLLTLSVNFKEIFKLGPKALIMFFTATIGVIVGGPLAILFFKYVAPDMLITVGDSQLWEGLSTVAGSWIGGGANQTAMKELYEVNDNMFSVMAVVDVLVAEVWMIFLLLGVAKSDKIDKYFKADASAVTNLKDKMHEFTKRTERVTSFNDIMIILGIAFGVTAIGHLIGDNFGPWIKENIPFLVKLSFHKSFFWYIIIATIGGIILSFTRVKNYEGAGASKIGTVFIYVLVAAIGMRMNLNAIIENISLFAIGFVWMIVHVGLLFIVGKIIKAPFFFLAVGSKANIGGAASAPVVAGAFHPSLAPVGVLLAVLGYVVGTIGAMLCAGMMEGVS